MHYKLYVEHYCGSNLIKCRLIVVKTPLSTPVRFSNLVTIFFPEI